MDKNICINLLNKYGIDAANLKELNNVSFETKNNDKTLIIKNFDEKEKVAMEYKTLLNLSKKMKVPSIYKNGEDYITEASVIEKIEGKEISTYEDKDASSYLLGSALGLLHVSEINEQSSEEELKKIWENYILSKTLYFGTKIISLFNKEFNDRIFNYLNENMHFVKEDYELTLLLGKISNSDYVVKDDRVYFNNFENCMVGDATSDFAMIYDYYYDNEEQLEKFLTGYQDYMNLPDNFENKLPFYKFINTLDRLIELSEDKENNKEEIDNMIDIVNAIIEGKYHVITNVEEF
ncbi:MAG: phosphotransferase [Clostridia bacterium]|nr:phosphotransferase [Clostridia bacterium]